MLVTDEFGLLSGGRRPLYRHWRQALCTLLGPHGVARTLRYSIVVVCSVGTEYRRGYLQYVQTVRGMIGSTALRIWC